MSIENRPADPANEPTIHLDATFYFPPGVTYEAACGVVNDALGDLDRTSVITEILPATRARWLQESER